MNPSTMEVVATVLFAIAVLHTFMVKRFEHIAHKYPKGSMGENLFHFLGEVEVVFGLWAGVLITFFTAMKGSHDMIHFLEKDVNFTEPVFVFVIMSMAGTRPVIKLAENIILLVSKLIPLPGRMSFFLSTLIIGPLLGSFITEPAAMTVSALILQKNFYSDESMSTKFKYATLGLLFVNVSIGGTLTHFAAPPVLMVAKAWGLDQGLTIMAGMYGYKAAISVLIGSIIVALMFKNELQGAYEKKAADDGKLNPTWWIYLFHIIFLGLVVWSSHHMVFFLGLFLFFVGFTTVTQEYQDDRLKIKESLLVGFFLGGLVVLGKFQAWWLKPVLTQMGDFALFVGATGLTAITDNAALTFLGAQVDGLSASAQYNLLAGAVAGGGLTVIANAPNPAGFGILKENFGKEGISPLGLLAGAIGPTILVMILFQILPSL